MSFINELKQKARDVLMSRSQAYNQVFNPESVFVQKVMKDLIKFCRARESAFHIDPRLNAVLEGRREVFLRIQDHTGLDPEAFLKKYGRDIV